MEPKEGAEAGFSVLYACGEEHQHQRFVFKTRDTYVCWSAIVEGLKEETKAIKARRNHRLRTTGKDDADLEKPAYIKWLQVAGVLRRLFGDDYVPWDIKWAVNNVETGVGKPLTAWD